MITKALENPFTDLDHDHANCIVEALNSAKAACKISGARLTPLRLKVLELIWRSHSPVGAYDLLEMLREERGRVAPTTVYRSLEFLCRQGFVHRLDSLQAFIGCGHPTGHYGGDHAAHFLICQDCGMALEICDGPLEGAIEGLVGRLDFTIAGETIELRGVCSACQL